MAAGAHPNRVLDRTDVPRSDRPTTRLPTRLTRIGRHVGLGLGALVIFMASAIVGALVHLGTPLARRIAAGQVNAILATAFRGRIRIDGLGGLSLSGVRGANATMLDATGRPTLEVRGVRVRIATWAAVRSALFGKRAPIDLSLSELSIDTVDVRLDTDASGNLDLLNALDPMVPQPADPNARGLRLVVARIAVGHAWAHGQMATAPFLDVHVDDLAGALTYAGDLLEGDISGAKIVVHRIANGLDVEGALRAHVKKTADIKGLAAHVDWRGSVGTSAHTLLASLDDGRVNVVLDIPALAPDDLRSLWPGSGVNKAGLVHFDAHGALSSIEVRLDTALGESTFRASGTLSVADDKRAVLAFDGSNLDVHEFAASAPESRLALTGNVSMASDSNGALDGKIAVRFKGGRLGDHSVPAADIRGSVTRGEEKGVRGDAEIVVDEPAAPTRLTASISREGHASTARFDLQSNVPDFDRLPELGHTVKGSLRVAANGSLDLERMMVDAHATATARGLIYGSTAIQNADLVAHGHGTASDPHAELALHAQGIAAASMRLNSLDVTASGRARAPHVSVTERGVDIPDIDATAGVSTDNGFEVSGLNAVVTRAGIRALMTAKRLSQTGSDIRVDGVRVEGLGAPVDLARLGFLAHVETRVQHGTVSLDTDLDLRRSSASGRAKLDLVDGVVGGIRGLGAHIDLTLAGRKLSGQVHAEASGLGSVDIGAPHFALGGGGALTPSSWRQALGDVSFDAHADLERIAAALPPERVPLAEARGQIVVKGHAVRDDPSDPLANVTLSIKTNNLVLTPKTVMTRDIDGVYVMPAPAWRLAGIDFVIDGNADGVKGDVQLSAKLSDKKGEIAQVSAKAARFPFDDVERNATRTRGDLREMPFEVRVAIPERGLGSLPDILKQDYMSGRMTANVTATGTMRAPKVHVDVGIQQSKVAGTSHSLPLAFAITGDYDGIHGKVSIKATSASRALLDADGQFDAAISQVFDSGQIPNWQGTLRAHLDGFPLEAVTLLDDKLIAGPMSGDFSITDLHKNASANVALSVEPFSVGTVRYKSARIQAKVGDSVVDALARFDQTDGFAEAKAHAPASWGAALAPALDPGHPLDMALSAKNFRIAGLLPFVDHWLDELDGRLDADAHAELDPRSRGAKVSGSVALSRGAIQAGAGGGEFHDIAAKVSFSPEGVVTLEKLTAAGMSGRLEANASIHLNGTSLESARGVILIPSDAPIPLNTGGTDLGNVDGRIDASESTSAGGAINLKVDVPHLRVALPQGSSTDVQALGKMPKVQIGAHRGHPLKFVLVALDPAMQNDTSVTPQGGPTTIQTHLADIEVVRENQLAIGLTGDIEVNAGKTTDVKGRIDLKKGGVLAVQGKTFTIESGTVTFVGTDPSNPQVVVKAGWTGPDGTVVYANFVGPLKTGKVTLTSEPALPQQEIVELLLFGTVDGQQAQSPTGAPATAAIGTVGGEAAQPLNHMLNQLGLGSVTTRVDTSDSSAPKPEVEIQIARDISIQIAVVLGTPPPGVNPDLTLLTVDWRFLNKWSLSSTLGNAGTTIFDVLWQRRY